VDNFINSPGHRKIPARTNQPRERAFLSLAEKTTTSKTPQVYPAKEDTLSELSRVSVKRPETMRI